MDDSTDRFQIGELDSLQIFCVSTAENLSKLSSILNSVNPKAVSGGYPKFSPWECQISLKGFQEVGLAE